MCWLLILQDSTTGCTGGAPKSDLWGETEGAPFGVLGKGCGWSAKGACRGERFFAPTFLIRVGSHLAPPAWPRRRSYGRSPRFGPGLRPRGKPAQPSGYTAPLPLSRGTPNSLSLDGAPSPPPGSGAPKRMHQHRRRHPRRKLPPAREIPGRFPLRRNGPPGPRPPRRLACPPPGSSAPSQLLAHPGSDPSETPFLPLITLLLLITPDPPLPELRRWGNPSGPPCCTVRSTLGQAQFENARAATWDLETTRGTERKMRRG